MEIDKHGKKCPINLSFFTAATHECLASFPVVLLKRVVATVSALRNLYGARQCKKLSFFSLPWDKLARQFITRY